MRRIFKILAFCFVLSLVFLGITCRNYNSDILADASGRPGELLVVMDQALWEGKAGEAVKKIFGQPYDVLPQYEPCFDIIHIVPDAFKDFFLLYGNILYVDISPQYSISEMYVEHDKYSSIQVITGIYSGDELRFSEFINENNEKLLSVFEQAELNRLVNNYARTANNQFYQVQ